MVELHQYRYPYQSSSFPVTAVAARLYPRILACALPPRCPSLISTASRSPAMEAWAQISSPWKMPSPSDHIMGMGEIGFQFVLTIMGRCSYLFFSSWVLVRGFVKGSTELQQALYLWILSPWYGGEAWQDTNISLIDVLSYVVLYN